jgi:predicted Zn-dependent protease
MSQMNMSEAVEIAMDLVGQGVVVGEINNARNLRWANSALTTNGDTVDQSLSIAAFVDTADGVASGISSGQVRNREDIEKLVAASKASARAAGPAQDAMDLVAGPQHADFHSEVAPITDEGIDFLSIQLGNVLPHGQFFGYAEQAQDTMFVATSAGTRMRFSQSTSRFELCAKSLDRERSAWSGQSGTSLSDVMVTSHADTVLRGLEYQKNGIDQEPGLHKVTLSPSAMADLMIYMLWSATAREAHEGRSVFSSPLGGTRIGEQLTQRQLTVATDPALRGLETIDHVVNLGSSSMSSSFDTGLATPRSEILRDGQLHALGSSRHAALEANLPFTPLSDNIEVRDAQGSGSLDELAARMGDGLLITCLWYIREVDPQSLLLTGLTRDGVYVVKNGEIIGASNNFRFNESPVGMLSRITDAGEAVNCLPRAWADWFSRARLAPVTVDQFNLSTRSDAV